MNIEDKYNVSISCDLVTKQIHIDYPGGLWETNCTEETKNVWGNEEISYDLSHNEIVGLIKILLQSSGLKDLLDISNSIRGLANHLERDL